MKGRKWVPVFKYKTRNDFLQSRELQREKVFMRTKQSVRLHSSSIQDWYQEQSQNFVSQDQMLLMKKCANRGIFNMHHGLYCFGKSIYFELENSSVRN